MATLKVKPKRRRGRDSEGRPGFDLVQGEPAWEGRALIRVDVQSVQIALVGSKGREKRAFIIKGRRADSPSG